MGEPLATGESFGWRICDAPASGFEALGEWLLTGVLSLRAKRPTEDSVSSWAAARADSQGGCRPAIASCRGHPPALRFAQQAFLRRSGPSCSWTGVQSGGDPHLQIPFPSTPSSSYTLAMQHRNVAGSVSLRFFMLCGSMLGK